MLTSTWTSLSDVYILLSPIDQCTYLQVNLFLDHKCYSYITHNGYNSPVQFMSSYPTNTVPRLLITIHGINAPLTCKLWSRLLLHHAINTTVWSNLGKVARSSIVSIGHRLDIFMHCLMCSLRGRAVTISSVLFSRVLQIILDPPFIELMNIAYRDFFFVPGG